MFLEMLLLHIRIHFYKSAIISYILLLLTAFTISIYTFNTKIQLNDQNELLLDSNFPIDLVYTWVNGRDIRWINEFTKACRQMKLKYDKKDILNRFIDIEEIRYSLRSVEKNLHWIRYIFIVTWIDQRPYWINNSHPKIKFISQSQIFPLNYHLPTFNSKSIDFLIYKIPGLSEHFIYSNDDMYFTRLLKPSNFFTKSGKPIFILSKNRKGKISTQNQRYRIQYKTDKNDGFLYMITVTNTLIQFLNIYNKVFPFGYSHVPIPLTKKICEEAYSNFKEDIDRTISNRFRNIEDFQMQTLMIQYGLLTNMAVGEVKNDHISMFIVASSVSKNKINYNLIKIKRKPPNLLAINIDDVNSRRKIKAFLDCMFEKPSSFELSDKPPEVDIALKKFWKRNIFSFDFSFADMFRNWIGKNETQKKRKPKNDEKDLNFVYKYF